MIGRLWTATRKRPAIPALSSRPSWAAHPGGDIEVRPVYGRRLPPRGKRHTGGHWRHEGPSFQIRHPAGASAGPWLGSIG